MEIPDSIRCAKCNWIMKHPVQTECCEKSFCLNCKCECKGRTFIFLPVLDRQIREFTKKMKGKDVCFVCELVGAHPTKLCPEITCLYCKKRGHPEIFCPAKMGNNAAKHVSKKKVKVRVVFMDEAEDAKEISNKTKSKPEQRVKDLVSEIIETVKEVKQEKTSPKNNQSQVMKCCQADQAGKHASAKEKSKKASIKDIKKEKILKTQKEAN